MSSTTLATQHEPFLRTVVEEGNLTSVQEARAATEVVYRALRDLMNSDTLERVAAELGDRTVAAAPPQSLQTPLVDLWVATNPLVSWLSHIRPVFNRSGKVGIDDSQFLRQIERDGGVPAQTDAVTLITAVFKATKQELSAERIHAVSQCLPEGIRLLWNNA